MVSLCWLTSRATALGGSAFDPSLGDVAVPFLSSYETLWTSTGIVAFWMLVVLGISYYARGWIGVQRWRKLHRLTALAWIMGVAHSLGEGTDAGQAWFLAMTAIVVTPPLVLLLKVHLSAQKRTPTAAIDTAIAHTSQPLEWSRP